MANCTVCGAHITGMEVLECEDCGQSFCRQDYHGHGCSAAEDDPTEDEIGEAKPETTAGSTTESSSSTRTAALVGYTVGTLVAMVGAVYLLPGLSYILFGGSAQQGLGVIVQMVVASALFAAATFILVATYIAVGD